MRTASQIHQEGAARFGERWSQMNLQILEAARENQLDLSAPHAQQLLAELTWRACIQAWGAATAHSATVPCSRQSVGVIIYRGQDLLLLERLSGAIGMAPPAGHVEPGETSDQAAIREVQEETGLILVSLHLVAQGRRFERCKRNGSDYHDWWVYEGSVSGFEAHHNPTESKRLLFCPPDQVAELARRTEEHMEHLISDADWQARPGMEHVWYWWLKRAGYLQASKERA